MQDVECGRRSKEKGEPFPRGLERSREPREALLRAGTSCASGAPVWGSGVWNRRDPLPEEEAWEGQLRAPGSKRRRREEEATALCLRLSPEPAPAGDAEPRDPHALGGFFYFGFCRRWQILAFSVPFYIACCLGGEEHRARQAEAAHTQAAVGPEPRREHPRLRCVRFPARRALGDVMGWAGNVGDVMRWAGEDLLHVRVLATSYYFSDL